MKRLFLVVLFAATVAPLLAKQNQSGKRNQGVNQQPVVVPARVTEVSVHYPVATYPGTVELRLETKGQLSDLFDGFERSWITGHSRSFMPDGVEPFIVLKRSSSHGQYPSAPDAKASETN